MDAILQAAARVFAERGFAGGTTNRIAERAGVSIGSLYEYFPNKESILVALVERYMDEGMTRIDRLLGRSLSESRDLGAVLRGLVGAMLDFHRRQPELHRVLFEEAPHPPQLHACLLQLEEKLAHRLEGILRARPEAQVADPDTAAHFVVQVVESLTHRFVLHGIHDLSDESFTGEVVKLLAAYLGGEPGQPARRGCRETDPSLGSADASSGSQGFVS